MEPQRSGGEEPIEFLEASAARDPSDPAALVRLAAAWLDLAEREDRPDADAKALCAAEAALALDRTLARAHALRAEALEGLRLYDDAAQAWQGCVETFPESADRARQRLESLPERGAGGAQRERLAEAFERSDLPTLLRLAWARPDLGRDLVWDVALPTLSRALLTGSDFEQPLGVASALVASLERADADPLDREALDVFAQSRSLELAHAHLDDREGRLLLRSHQLAAATAFLQRALAGMEAARSPYAAWVRLQLALAAPVRAQDAIDHLGSMAAAARGRHGRLEASALAARARVRAAGRDPLGAHEDECSALAGFERCLDRRGRAVALSHLAELSDLLGDPREGWRQRARALDALSGADDPETLHVTLLGGGEASLRQDLPRVALKFADAVLTRAHGVSASEAIAARLLRSRAARRLGRTLDADRDVSAAWASLRRVSDPRSAEHAAIELFVEEGEVAVASGQSGTGSLLRAADHHRRNGHLGQLPRVLLTLGRAHRNDGRTDQAERAFRESLQRSLERGRPGRDAALELLRMELERGRAESAFGVLDASRALPGESLELEGATWLQRVAAERDTAFVAYASLEDRLIAWTAGEGSWQETAIPLGRGELRRRVSELRRALSPAGEGFRRVATSLGDALLGPLRRRLRDGTSLAIVPDDALCLLPFGALVEPASGRLLAEARPHALAWSARSFLATRARARAQIAPERVLATGAPSFERRRFGDLHTLPAADEEAAAVRQRYPAGELLAGPLATRSALLEAVGRAQVWHHAGPVRVNPLHPELSLLPLASGPSASDGALAAGDPAFSTFGKLRLAAFSCTLGELRLAEDRDSLEFVRALLAAGVPAVGWSLWPVQDAGTRELLVGFHAGMRRGARPAEALREARLGVLASRDPVARQPSRWAGFELYGA